MTVAVYCVSLCICYERTWIVSLCKLCKIHVTHIYCSCHIVWNERITQWHSLFHNIHSNTHLSQYTHFTPTYRSRHSLAQCRYRHHHLTIYTVKRVTQWHSFFHNVHSDTRSFTMYTVTLVLSQCTQWQLLHSGTGFLCAMSTPCTLWKNECHCVTSVTVCIVRWWCRYRCLRDSFP